MAKKQKQTTSSSSESSTTTSKSKGTSIAYILNILAFAAVCIGGIALFISMILGKLGVSASFVSAMQTIANAIGWVVLAILSFKYIRHRRKIWIWVVWTIAVIMIILGLVI